LVCGDQLRVVGGRGAGERGETSTFGAPDHFNLEIPTRSR
jgi:hypothetical protein